MTDTLIKATILLAAVTIAAHLLRRRSAALRHLLWTLAMVGLVALPVLAATSPFRIPILPSVGTTPKQERESPVVRFEKDPSGAKETYSRVAAPFPGQLSVPGDQTAPTSSTPIPWTRVLVGTWLAVLLAMLARFAAGFVIVNGMARRATAIAGESWNDLAARASRALDLKGPIDLRRSSEIAMPFACGLLRPVIVLPSSSNEWSVERREAVLMHELAHLSRGDLAMNMLSHIVRAVYWFHPLAWLAAYRLRVEGERACDDAVLRAGALPSDYAEHLLSIVRTVGTTVPNVALAMARRSDFEGRLLAILEPGVPRGRLTRLRVAGLAALFVGVVMPLSAMTTSGGTARTATENTAAENSATENNAAESSAPEESAATNSATATGAILGNSVARQQAVPPTTQNPQPAQPTSAVTALIETLSDGSPQVRTAAASSLGALGDPRAIAALAKALREDTDPRVREAAAYALGEIDDARAVAPLLEALKTERVAAVKEKIIGALGDIDDPSAVAGISALVKDPSVAVRRAVVQALGELEDPSAVPALLSLVRDDDVEVRQQTAQALGQFENPAAIDPLVTMTRDPDPEVRQYALSALGQFEDPRLLPTFVAALKDSNAEVRHEAAQGIGNLDGIKSAPRALIDALTDTDAEVRQAAVEALGSIGDEAAVAGIKKLTSDTSTDVRRAAAEALSEIGGVEAVQALMGLLKDQDPEIRRTAAEALGKKRHE